MTKPPALPVTRSPRDGAMLPEAIARALSADDHSTLAHLLRRGIGENTLRAARSDLAYLEVLSLACDGEPLPWPPTQEIVLRFIAHHLWDPDERAVNPQRGMPDYVRAPLMKTGFLRSEGPHAPSTVQRRFATWRSLCRWRGVDHPFSTPEVAKTLRAAIRASSRPRRRKSRQSVDTPLIEALLDHLDAFWETAVLGHAEEGSLRLNALRDRALLSTMFASGGRRRSEISDLVWGQTGARADRSRPSRLPGWHSQHGLDLGR